MSKLKKISEFEWRQAMDYREIWDPVIYTAKVYRDAESNEWRVRFYVDGKLRANADSFHTDKDDAINTARYSVERAAMTALNTCEGV